MSREVKPTNGAGGPIPGQAGPEEWPGLPDEMEQDITAYVQTRALIKPEDEALRRHLDRSVAHAVYPGGTPCSPACPGEWSSYHEGYADGHAESVTVERVAALGAEALLDDHSPWARAVFAEFVLWMACSCGWNIKRDARLETWNEHFLAAAAARTAGSPAALPDTEVTE